jgi:hypothetical protein
LQLRRRRDSLENGPGAESVRRRPQLGLAHVLAPHVVAETETAWLVPFVCMLVPRPSNIQRLNYASFGYVAASRPLEKYWEVDYGYFHRRFGIQIGNKKIYLPKKILNYLIMNMCKIFRFLNL